MKTSTPKFKRLAGLAMQASMWASVVVGLLWSVGAVFYHSYLSSFVAAFLSLAFAVSTVVWTQKTTGHRVKRQRLAICVALVYLSTLLQRPSNVRDWEEDNSQAASIQILNDEVRIEGFRNNVDTPESAAAVVYENRDFKLSSLRRVWFVVQRFTALEGIAHNFLTFEYVEDSVPRYFCVSVEIRREKGEAFSPVRGMYRQYELTYVVASEPDQIGMRTVPRPDDRVYLYEVNATATQVQKLFKDIAKRINALRDSPEFYHSLLNNCTNNIVLHTYQLTPEPINWLDPRIVAPGYADRFAYSYGLIGQHHESFEALRTRSRIDEIARASGVTLNFSQQIRRLAPAK